MCSYRLGQVLGGAKSRLRYLAVKTFVSWPDRPEADLKSFGIDVYRFVGTTPGIFGLASSGFGAAVGPKSKISGRILKSFRGPLSSAEKMFGRVGRPAGGALFG